MTSGIFTPFFFTENNWKLIICLIDQALELCNSNAIPENSYIGSIRGNSYSIIGNNYSCGEF
jgi:hypothetical protein